MTSRTRELVWKTPYKPTQAAESQASQAPPVSRRSSSLSPKSRPAPASTTSAETSFHFPQRDYSTTNDSSGSWPFHRAQSPLSPNMADPNTVNEVGSSKFPLKKLCGPGAASYYFLPSLITAGTQAEKSKMIASLRNHSVNTLAELRRIERIFATMGTSDLTEPMTTACMCN